MVIDMFTRVLSLLFANEKSSKTEEISTVLILSGSLRRYITKISFDSSKWSLTFWVDTEVTPTFW